MTVRWSSRALVAALVLGAACSPGAGGGGGPGIDAGTPGTDLGARSDLGAREGGAACGAATTCGTCSAMGPCGWCGRTGRCLEGGSTGSADMSCTGADWAFLASRCGPDGGVLPPVDAAAQCAMATSCSTCSAMGPCGWCGRTGRCLQGGSTGSADMSCTGADWAFTSSRCGADGGVLPPVDASAQCAMATACGACTAMGPCGWCTRTNRCLQGSSTGSGDMSCTGMDWDFLGRTCPRPDAGPSCEGVPRSCGLTLAGAVRTCTPGQMLTAGCNANCAPALGSCTGDPVMQICPGNATTAPCAETAAIASNDDPAPAAMCRPDGGSNLCPVTTFMCPSNGMYTIWVGAYDSTEMATCTPAVR